MKRAIVLTTFGAALWSLAGAARADDAMNLVPNGDFEQPAAKGAVPGWQTAGNGTVTVTDQDPRQGRQCVQMENTDAKQKCMLIVELPLDQKQPETLLIDFSVKIDTPVPPAEARKMGVFQFGYTLACTYASGRFKQFPAGVYGGLPAAKEGWQDVSFRWRPSEPIASAKLMFYWQHPGTMRIDKIRITPLSQVLQAAWKPQTLPPDLAQQWQPTALDLTFEAGELPDALRRHLGNWKVADGALSSEGELPRAGAVVRSTDVYLPTEFEITFRQDSPDGALFLVVGNWKVQLYPTHVGLYYLGPPMSRYPVVKDVDAAAGKEHTLRLVWQLREVALELDGKEILRLRQEDCPEAEATDVLFVKTDSPFYIQTYQSPIRIDRVKLKGLKTGVLEGVERLK